MQKHVALVRDGLTLRGMLHIPEGYSGKVPGVAMYHGFMNNKMESRFIFVRLSRMLEKAGIASVRFDFYGSGESDGDFSEMTPETELRDAKAILDYLRGLDFIDSERVGICGLSMGGYIGGITAGDNRDLVKAMCLWAPAGIMESVFQSSIEKGVKVGENLFDIGGLVVSYDAYECARGINPYERAAAFHKESCIIHGTRDKSIPYEVGLKYRDMLKKAEFHGIGGADHTFNRSDCQEQVLDITVGFFKRTL
jgi:dipeptidyl aminopeptidase/acylaminoacyl peptidase